MNATRSRDPDQHDEISLLLPWYVNQTLGALECARVRRHLQACSECRVELAAQRALRTQIRSAMPVETAVGPALERFKARIQADGHDSTSRAGRDVREPVSVRRRWRWPSPVIWAAAAGLFAAFVLPSLPQFRVAAPGHLFHTAASPASYSRFENDDVRVVFARPLSEAAIEAILTPLQGRVVDGPVGAGIYTVRFESEPASRDYVDQCIERLRANKDVALAEPAIPVAGSGH